MSADDFKISFDAEGRYRAGAGEIQVVFVTWRGVRFPGKLGFKNGLCVQTSTEYAGWFGPEFGSLDNVSFRLLFEGEKLLEATVERGRIILQDDPTKCVGKKPFPDAACGA